MAKKNVLILELK